MASNFKTWEQLTPPLQSKKLLKAGFVKKLPYSRKPNMDIVHILVIR